MKKAIHCKKEVVVLLSHGSSKKYAKQVLTSLKKKLSSILQKYNVQFFHAFLQINKPLLEDCLLGIMDSKNIKISKIIILPVFISHGKHTRDDLINIVRKFKKSYEKPNIKLAEPLGDDEFLVKLLAKRYKNIRNTKILV